MTFYNLKKIVKCREVKIHIFIRRIFKFYLILTFIQKFLWKLYDYIAEVFLKLCIIYYINKYDTIL